MKRKGDHSRGKDRYRKMRNPKVRALATKQQLAALAERFKK